MMRGQLGRFDGQIGERFSINQSGEEAGCEFSSQAEVGPTAERRFQLRRAFEAANNRLGPLGAGSICPRSKVSYSVTRVHPRPRLPMMCSLRTNTSVNGLIEVMLTSAATLPRMSIF